MKLLFLPSISDTVRGTGSSSTISFSSTGSIEAVQLNDGKRGARGDGLGSSRPRTGVSVISGLPVSGKLLMLHVACCAPSRSGRGWPAGAEERPKEGAVVVQWLRQDAVCDGCCVTAVCGGFFS